MNYSEIINAALAAAGKSQFELARLMGREQSSVNRMCSGRHRPTLATLEAVAKALKVTLVVKFTEEPAP